MGEVSPNFKSALNFFNSLDRGGGGGGGSPLIPRKKSSSFEVNLKLIVDSRTVENITNYDVKTFIPRARLTTSKRAVLCSESANRSFESESLKRNDNNSKPQLPPRRRRHSEKTPSPLETRNKDNNTIQYDKPSTSNTLDSKVTQKIQLVKEETSLKTESFCSVQGDQPLTPDIEAKQIIEAFKKEITPYNTFEIPVNALDSDFFKQTLNLVPDITVSFSNNKPKRNSSFYRLPKNLEKDER